MPSSDRACSIDGLTSPDSSAFAVARTSIAPSSCASSSRPGVPAAASVVAATGSAKNDAPGRGSALPTSAAARVMARAEEMRTCETTRARRDGTRSSASSLCVGVLTWLPGDLVVQDPRVGPAQSPPGTRDVARPAPRCRTVAVPSSEHRTPRPRGSHLLLTWRMENASMSSPTRHRRSTSRAVAGLAVAASALLLSACGEDGSVSVPEFTLTGDGLEQLLDDARSQAETIADDVRSLADDLGSLPEDTRTRAEEAVSAAQDAADEARAAVDEAADATDAQRAEAERRLADAEAGLESASSRLESVASSLSGADEAVRSGLDDLRARVDELRAEIDASTS